MCEVICSGAGGSCLCLITQLSFIVHPEWLDQRWTDLKDNVWNIPVEDVGTFRKSPYPNYLKMCFWVMLLSVVLPKKKAVFITCWSSTNRLTLLVLLIPLKHWSGAPAVTDADAGSGTSHQVPIMSSGVPLAHSFHISLLALCFADEGIAQCT